MARFRSASASAIHFSCSSSEPSILRSRPWASFSEPTRDVALITVARASGTGLGSSPGATGLVLRLMIPPSDAVVAPTCSSTSRSALPRASGAPLPSTPPSGAITYLPASGPSAWVNSNWTNGK